MIGVIIIVATIGALIYSLMCFRYGGTPTDKIVGFVIAYLLLSYKKLITLSISKGFL